jgi:hypothetical protein
MSISTPEPRWPAFGHPGSCWGLLGPARMIPIVITNRRGYFKITRMLTFAALAPITLAMIASLIFLVRGIPSHREMPKTLSRSALALWITNILVFALWYWKLDAGGPLGRDYSRRKRW